MFQAMNKRLQKALKPKKQNKPKRNNQGMTLVEVIIAITILSLVAIPVLRSITSAMYYNAKARTRQSVTLSAESLMETFKGYDLESLQSMFARADSGDATAMAELGITGATGYAYPSSSDLGNPTLDFKVEGMESDDGKTTCDIAIKATRQDYVEVMEVDNILPTRDAIYRGDRDCDTNAWDKAQQDFIDNYQADFLTLINSVDERGREVIESDIDFSCLTLTKRQTIFHIFNDGTNDIVTASMVYSYSMKQHPYYELAAVSETEEAETEEASEEEASEEASSAETDGLDEAYLDYPASGDLQIVIPLSFYTQLPSNPDEYIVYSNPVDEEEHPLQRVLLYYYPVYDVTDEITINNSMGLAFDCYLIKQKAPEMSNIQLETKESLYTASVNGSGLNTISLYHNFKTNLGGGSPTPGAGHIIGFAQAQEYDGSSFVKKKVLVYKLEMTVFNSQGNEIARFDGTMNENMDYTP